MQGKKKLSVIASLAVAPLIGGAAGVAVAALPAAAAPVPAAHAATFAVHSTASGHATGDPEDSQSEAPGSGEQQTKADGPGGHEDAPGTNVDHQFTGTE